MIIKKFQAKTEKEATETAKKELGAGVVIMNVKEVKRKGFFGFFSPNLVEVTVALEEEGERQNAAPFPIPEKKEVTAPMVPNSVWERMEAEKKEKKAEAENPRGKAIEEKLDNLQELLSQQLKQAETEKEKEEKDEEKKDSEIATFTRLLYNTMIDNEVRDQYANQIIDEVEKNTVPGAQIDFALSTVYQKMILKFGQASIIEEGEKKPKVLFFIGPTGVGKTTTIAKLASKFCVEEKRKVALLTADTYRIAAAEQLRTYANILEVPFRVIYAPEEISQAIKEFRNYDYILVDTAGHSYQNEEQKATIQEFLQSVEEYADKEVYLVLSATTKYRDLVSIADTYKSITEYRLIFTKLDETTAFGNLYNLHLYTGAPLSYVTCGQNVPDDIQIFNPQSTVKRILSGSL